MSDDTRPDAQPAKRKKTEPRIRVVTLAQDGTKDQFEISPSTEMKKLMDAYCKHKKVLRHQVKFWFKTDRGRFRIRDESTAHTLGMGNKDQIQVQYVRIRVVTLAQDGTKDQFEISPSAEMRKLMDFYCKHKKVLRHQVKFWFNTDRGRLRIRDESTAHTLGMGNKDQIQVQYVRPRGKGAFHKIYYDDEDEVVVRQLRPVNALFMPQEIVDRIIKRVDVLSKYKETLVHENKILPEFEPYNKEGWMTVARGEPLTKNVDHINMFCDFVMRFAQISDEWALEDAKRNNFLIMPDNTCRVGDIDMVFPVNDENEPEYYWYCSFTFLPDVFPDDTDYPNPKIWSHLHSWFGLLVTFFELCSGWLQNFDSFNKYELHQKGRQPKNYGAGEDRRYAIVKECVDAITTQLNHNQSYKKLRDTVVFAHERYKGYCTILKHMDPRFEPCLASFVDLCTVPPPQAAARSTNAACMPHSV